VAASSHSPARGAVPVVLVVVWGPFPGERCGRGKRVRSRWRGSVSCARPLLNRGRFGNRDGKRSVDRQAAWWWPRHGGL